MTSQLSFTLHRSPSSAMQAGIGGALSYLVERSCEVFSNWVQPSPEADRADRTDEIIAAVINLGKTHLSGRCSHS